MKAALRAIVVGALCVVVLPSVIQAAPIACGPGVDWASPANCPAGTDTFDSVATVTGIILGIPFVLFADGTTVVDRDTPIDGGTHWIIDTEIVSMSLEGNHPLLGDFEIRKPGASPSTGQITQLKGSAFANSFFDVFFELDTNFGTFHNNDPARVGVVGIPFIPPYGFSYTCPPPPGIPPPPPGGSTCVPPLQIYDAQNNPVGVVTSIVHTPVPEPASMFLLAVGLAGALVRARNTRQRGRAQ